MDDAQFDALTRRLGAGSDRRRFVGSLVAGLGGLLGLATVRQGAAKRKRGRKAKGRQTTKEAKGGGGGKPQGRCQAGQTNCRGKCVDLTDNPEHCGACATACSPGEDCCNGACVPSCSGGAIRDAACICQPPPPPTCGPDSCSGCCDGTTCREGSTSNFCGRGGSSCDACNALETCAGGFCACQRECCENVHCEPPGASRCTHLGTCEACIPNGVSPGPTCFNPDPPVPCCGGSCVGIGGVAYCGCFPAGVAPGGHGCSACCSNTCDATGNVCAAA